jgi:2-iminobutanoate/2-iminopropanoate deaminase
VIRPLLRAATVMGAVLFLGAAIFSFGSSTSVASAASAAVAQAPAKQTFGRASSTLTPAILIGNTLYLSGQLGTSGKADGIAGETKAAILAGQELLKQAQMDLQDVVAVTVYLTDVADFAGMNKAYSELFSATPRPTRTTVVVKELVVAGAKVEVTMTAVKAR